MKWRYIIVFAILGSIVYAIGYLFYEQEIRFWLPTPIPKNHVEVSTGTTVKLAHFKKGKKKFVHFYNPNCPCSKFNLTNYKALIKDYHQDFQCFAVVQESLEGVKSSDRAYLEKLGVKLIIDQNKEIAQQCGVYSTPQIVLLDENNKLYFRGNYNKARYCTSPATNYAKIAIDSMLQQSYYIFSASATTAYGCDLERHTH